MEKTDILLNLSNGKNNGNVTSSLCENLFVYNQDKIQRKKKVPYKNKERDNKDDLDEKKDMYICNDDSSVITSSEKGVTKERIHMNKEKLNYNGSMECSSVCVEKNNMSYIARRIQNMMYDTKEKMKLDRSMMVIILLLIFSPFLFICIMILFCACPISEDEKVYLFKS